MRKMEGQRLKEERESTDLRIERNARTMKEAEKHVRVVNDYAETDSNFFMASY